MDPSSVIEAADVLVSVLLLLFNFVHVLQILEESDLPIRRMQGGMQKDADAMEERKRTLG
jgi:hypothetical protein